MAKGDKKSKGNDENIPDPFFHESEDYSSAFFGPLPDKILETIPSKADDKAKDELVNQLTNPELRESRSDVLSLLKEDGSQELLMEIIADKKYKKQRAVLIATCWETGLDFSKYLEEFIDLLEDRDTDDFSAIEIATVIEEMPGPFEENVVEECVRRLESVSVNEPLKKEMLSGIIFRLRTFVK